MSVCIFRLDEECHAAKKGHKVCKHCWDIATFKQQETLKHDMEGFCRKYMCWEMAGKDADFCARHEERGGTERGRSRTPRRASSMPSPSPTRREGSPFNMFRCSTAELVSHSNACVAVLETRATS